MIICHSRKFIFVHIHKTGGTSIERALDPHLAWNDLILGGSPFGERIQHPYAKKFGLNKHSTISEIETICGSGLVESYFVFSLVRNPLSRLCSMYNFVATTLRKWAVTQKIDFDDIATHITPQAAEAKPALKWASTKAFLRSRNFSEFIRHKGLAAAPGFRSQVSCLSGRDNGPLKAHFFRIEDSAEWVDELIEQVGIQFVLPKANESDLRLQADCAVMAEDRAFVESLFRQDYETFGYV